MTNQTPIVMSLLRKKGIALERINKSIILAIFLVLIVGVIYINSKNSITNSAEKNNLIYEEAKFYGVNYDFDNTDSSGEDKDLERDIYIDEAKFFGISADFLEKI